MGPGRGGKEDSKPLKETIRGGESTKGRKRKKKTGERDRGIQMAVWRTTYREHQNETYIKDERASR